MIQVYFFDKNLIIKYKKRLYPAKIAMPMLFSLLAFGRPLTDKAIKKLDKKVCVLRRDIVFMSKQLDLKFDCVF